MDQEVGILKGLHTLSSFVTIVVAIILLVVADVLPLDYYIIPLTLCGAISLAKIVYYLKQPEPFVNVFLVIWIVLFINSFIAPIIHLKDNYWVKYMPDYPADWNLYAFYISLIYLIGILLMNFFFQKDIKKMNIAKRWTFKPLAATVIVCLMIIIFILQTFIYIQFGGLTGYIYAYATGTKDESAFSGMGSLFIISELFPYLFTILFVLKNKGKEVGNLKVTIFLVLLFISALYFGGLRGSRSNTLFVVIQGIIAIHLLVYRFNRNHLVLFVILFFSFMFLGRLYKDKGDNILDFQQKMENRLETKEDISETEKIIIGDLSRYGINCYQLYKLNTAKNYNYKYGQTYLSGVLTYLPFGTQIRDELGVVQRTEAGTELLYSRQVGQSQYRNTRIFGLVGEWFLNFGVYTFFIPYILIALLILRIRRWTISISRNDARILLLPLIMILIPSFFLLDANNIIFFIVKRVVTIYIILYFVTSREAA